jgi:hypothetical protein
VYIQDESSDADSLYKLGRPTTVVRVGQNPAPRVLVQDVAYVGVGPRGLLVPLSSPRALAVEAGFEAAVPLHDSLGTAYRIGKLDASSGLPLGDFLRVTPTMGVQKIEAPDPDWSPAAILFCSKNLREDTVPIAYWTRLDQLPNSVQQAPKALVTRAVGEVIQDPAVLARFFQESVIAAMQARTGYVPVPIPFSTTVYDCETETFRPSLAALHALFSDSNHTLCLVVPMAT